MNLTSPGQSRSPVPSTPRLITVIQGEIEISSNPNIELSTILGSCVAVCMWDPQQGVGGMNHFLLSDGGASNAVKYGAYAMEMLINGLLKHGARRSSLQSKIFGGASVSNIAGDIGQKNGEFARNFLMNEGIPCLGESLGGAKARRVRFNPVSGGVRLLFVQPTEVAPLETAKPARKPDITLF